MRFSVIFEAQTNDASPGNEHRVVQQCVEQAVFAEAMGFDTVWAVEHHALTWYAHMSAPEIFLSYVAAKTSRIGLGHGCVLMPFGFNHPLRVAERVGMLDSLSGGRLHVGAGRGATQQEMGMFGVDVADTYPQMEETLRIISNVWRADRFEWHSDVIDLPSRPVHPSPIQHPHPPLYMACTKRDTVRLAAELGVGALVLGFGGPEEIGVLRAIYDQAIAERTGERFVSDHANDHFERAVPVDRVGRRRAGSPDRHPRPALLRRVHPLLVRHRAPARAGCGRRRRPHRDGQGLRAHRRQAARDERAGVASRHHPLRPAGARLR
ncbi:MAG: LLM class flavin-dependent oxidoreductase [Ilumatobacteraceae bacterium]